MQKIVFVYGTRPEAIKLGPIVAELPDSIPIATGQHSDLLKGTPAESDLAHSLSLNLPSSGDVHEWVGKAIPVLLEKLEEIRPGLVVVQGDTMSAYAGSLAATKLRIPLAHVEAGLRSGDLEEPWPEERIRRAIALRTQWHYAPTRKAQCNLLREGIPLSRIQMLGNPVVSAIDRYASLTPVEVPKAQILVTMHRREWTDLGSALVRDTIYAFLETASEYPDIRFIWPVHPGVRKLAELDFATVPQNVSICPPMPYRATIDTLKASLGVATDSGGLCEESAILGVPCAILRNLTDRPESIEAGLAKLFAPCPEGIKAGLRCLIGRELPRTLTQVYGTKESAKLIASDLAHLVQLS